MPRSPRVISRVRSRQNVSSPTADLIPTGRPVSAATASTKSRRLSASWKAVCAEGLTQSRSVAIPRTSAISRVIFSRGRRPPRPGFAPWLSLISIARTEGVAATVSFNRAIENRPSRSRQPK